METPMQDGSSAPVASGVEQQQNSNGNGAGDARAQAEGTVKDLEAWLEDKFVTKAPFQIPMGGKEFLVMVAPYLVMIGAVMFGISILGLLGLGALGFGAMMVAGGSMGWGYGVIISLVTGAIVVAIEVYAVSGLFKRTRASWTLMYYAALVSFAGNVLSFNFIGAIVGALIGGYILFQVKELYKN